MQNWSLRRTGWSLLSYHWLHSLHRHHKQCRRVWNLLLNCLRQPVNLKCISSHLKESRMMKWRLRRSRLVKQLEKHWIRSPHRRQAELITLNNSLMTQLKIWRSLKSQFRIRVRSNRIRKSCHRSLKSKSKSKFSLRIWHWKLRRKSTKSSMQSRHCKEQSLLIHWRDMTLTPSFWKVSRGSETSQFTRRISWYSGQAWMSRASKMIFKANLCQFLPGSMSTLNRIHHLKDRKSLWKWR